MVNERKSDFYAVVEKEGLIRHEYLGTFSPLIKAEESHPDSENPLWHIYLLRTRAKNISNVTERFSRITKPEWYSIFWNEQKTYIVLTNRIITISTEKEWQSPEYRQMQQEAQSLGIQPEYLDLNKNFEGYRELIKKAKIEQ